VVNPVPGGGTSNVAFFEITNPTPTVSFNRSDLALYGPGTGVVGADFNGDGKLDLAAIDDNGYVSIFLGNGDGTFGARPDYYVGGGPEGIAIADFNGDGKLDIAVANPGSSAVSLLFGNGDGTFSAPVNHPCGGRPEAIAIGDFNGDDNLDLAVSNTNEPDFRTFEGLEHHPPYLCALQAAPFA